jgi:hypothetical protein
MTKSNTKRTQIKNYYRVKEALYHHFPKEAIVDYPLEHSIYLSAIHFFKEEGQCVLIYYAQDRLLYPHHIEYVHDIPYYGYSGIACVNEDNKIISKYNEMQVNLSPTPKDIEDLCGFTLKEIKRMKEFIKLKKIKDDF